MGNSAKKLKRDQEEEDEHVKEILNTMANFLEQKCASASAEMKEAARVDQDLPILAIVDKTERYTLALKETPNEEVTGGIKKMFSGSFFSGLGDLICGAIKVFLGDRSVGKSEKRAFHIVYANNALLRVDYMMYNYTFDSNGIMSKHENAFCFLLQVGVLDMQKVNSQILLYELTKTIGDHKKMVAAARELHDVALFAKMLYRTIHSLNKASKEQEQEPKQDDQQKDKEEDPFEELNI